MVPAQAILDQFDRALQESQTSPDQAFVWLQVVSQFPPGLLIECETALALSRSLVKDWLHQYMFKDKPGDEGLRLAGSMAEWLADHQAFKNHQRPIPRAALEQRGMNIVHLEADHKLEDCTMAVFHATALMFNRTTSIKIVENHKGTSFIKDEDLRHAGA